MGVGPINVDQQRALEHEDEEQTKAWPHLEKLGDVMLADVTVSDIGRLLDLDAYTYPNRMMIKRLYEQYVGSTDWAPRRYRRE